MALPVFGCTPFLGIAIPLQRGIPIPGGAEWSFQKSPLFSFFFLFKPKIYILRRRKKILIFKSTQKKKKKRGAISGNSHSPTKRNPYSWRRRMEFPKKPIIFFFSFYSNPKFIF
jgi:hypothetical protein